MMQVNTKTVLVGKPAWQRLRVRAAERETNIKALIEELVERFLEELPANGKSKRKAA